MADAVLLKLSYVCSINRKEDKFALPVYQILLLPPRVLPLLSASVSLVLGLQV